MKVISFVTQKGGTGKSTLAVSLAVAAEAAGERVVILDMDPQGTSAAWHETRTAETPAVLNHNQVVSLPETLATLSKLFTLAIIDTAGVDSHANRGPMQAADLCLIPVRPSEADVKATMPTLQALTAMGRRFSLVINQAPTNKQARLTSAVTTRLSTHCMVVPVPIASRIDHQYAYALGQGVTEFAPDSKASSEVSDLWAWCKKQLSEVDHVQTKRRA